MLKKILISLGFTVVANIALAANDLTVTNATVTKVQAYETTDDSISVWIHLNENSRVGPNPSNSSNTCELWTHDKTVHSIVLAALMSGKKVTVSYIDRGEGTYWCNVRHLSVSSS